MEQKKVEEKRKRITKERNTHKPQVDKERRKPGSQRGENELRYACFWEALTSNSELQAPKFELFFNQEASGRGSSLSNV